MPKVRRKRCGKCQRNKRIEQFSIKLTAPDGLQSWCKTCCKEYQDSLVARNKTEYNRQTLQRMNKAREAVADTVKQYMRSRGCDDCGRKTHLTMVAYNGCWRSDLAFFMQSIPRYERLIKTLMNGTVLCKQCLATRQGRTGWFSIT